MLYYIYIILYVHYIILHYIILYYIILCTYVCVYGYNPHKSESATSVESNRSTSHKSTIPENSHGSWKMYKSDLLKILIIFHYWIYLGKLYHIYWFTKLSSSLFLCRFPLYIHHLWWRRTPAAPGTASSASCGSNQRLPSKLEPASQRSSGSRSWSQNPAEAQFFSNSSCSTLW